MLKEIYTLPELADYLNREPPVLMGCTMSEIMSALMMAVLLMIPVMIGFWMLFDFLIGFIAYILFVLMSGVGGIYILQAVKNGKPPGHHQIRFLLFKRRFFNTRQLMTESLRFGKNRRVKL